MPAAPSILGSTGSTTLVLVALLVVLGLAMVAASVWLVRATRTDTPALGPLEVLGDRRFSRRDGDARVAALAAARPEGALDPAPMVELEDPAPEPQPVPTPEPELEPAVAGPEPELSPVVAGPAEDEAPMRPADVDGEAELETDGDADGADVEARAETAPTSH